MQVLWILALVCFSCSLVVVVSAVVRFAKSPPPIVPEFTPGAPTLPPAIVVHLSVGDRVKDRQPWENEARAQKAWVN